MIHTKSQIQPVFLEAPKIWSSVQTRRENDSLKTLLSTEIVLRYKNRSIICVFLT